MFGYNTIKAEKKYEKQMFAYFKVKRTIESCQSIGHLLTTERLMFQYSRLYFDPALCWKLKMMLDRKLKTIIMSN